MQKNPFEIPVADEQEPAQAHTVTMPHVYLRRYARDMAVGESGYVSPHALYVDGQHRCWLNLGAPVTARTTWFHYLLITRLEQGFAVCTSEQNDWEITHEFYSTMELAPVVELEFSA